MSLNMVIPHSCQQVCILSCFNCTFLIYSYRKNDPLSVLSICVLHLTTQPIFSVKMQLRNTALCWRQLANRAASPLFCSVTEACSTRGDKTNQQQLLAFWQCHRTSTHLMQLLRHLDQKSKGLYDLSKITSILLIRTQHWSYNLKFWLLTANNSAASLFRAYMSTWPQLYDSESSLKMHRARPQDF